MADKNGSAVMELVVAQLKKDKKAAFADIKAVAEKKGLTVYPITYGRAKALLGLVPSAKRGEGKAARAKAGLPAKRGPGRPRKDDFAPRRGPGRPPKSSYAAYGPRRGPGRPRKAVNIVDSLGGLVTAMKDSERSAAGYRSALEKVRQIIDDALRG